MPVRKISSHRAKKPPTTARKIRDGDIAILLSIGLYQSFSLFSYHHRGKFKYAIGEMYKVSGKGDEGTGKGPESIDSA
jgi:hypothetical protein